MNPVDFCHRLSELRDHYLKCLEGVELDAERMSFAAREAQRSHLLQSIEATERILVARLPR